MSDFLKPSNVIDPGVVPKFNINDLIGDTQEDISGNVSGQNNPTTVEGMNANNNTNKLNNNGYDYGKFDFTDFDKLFPELNFNPNDYKDLTEHDQRLIKDLYDALNKKRQELRHTHYLKSDDYYNKLKNELIANKTDDKTPLITMLSHFFPGIGPIVSLVGASKMLDNIRTSDNEAWRKWTEAGSHFDARAKEYSNLNAELTKFVSSLRFDKGKHTREALANEQAGITNPYYTLIRNGALGFGGAPLTINHGYNGFKSSTKGQDKWKEFIEWLLKILPGIAG